MLRKSLSVIFNIVFVLAIALWPLSRLLYSYGVFDENVAEIIGLFIKILTPILLIIAVKDVRDILTKGGSLVAPMVVCAAIALLVIIFIVYTTKLDYIDSQGRSLAIFNQGIALMHVVYFVLGILSVSLKSIKGIVATGWILMSSIVLYFIDVTTLSLNVNDMENQSSAIFLHYGDSFALITILMVALNRSFVQKMMIYIAGLTVAFFLYSRTSFYGLFMLFPIFYIYHRGKLGTLYVLSLLPVIGLLLYISWDELSTHRMLAFISIGQDVSIIERQVQLAYGLEDISNNFVRGNYGGQLDVFSGIGTYMHNILSYWRQFGLIVMLGVAYLMFRGITLSTGILRTKIRGDYRVEFFVLSFLFVTAISIVSRSYVNSHLWFVFGMLVSVAPLVKVPLVLKRTRS